MYTLTINFGASITKVGFDSRQGAEGGVQAILAFVVAGRFSTNPTHVEIADPAGDVVYQAEIAVQ